MITCRKCGTEIEFTRKDVKCPKCGHPDFTSGETLLDLIDWIFEGDPEGRKGILLSVGVDPDASREEVLRDWNKDIKDDK